jgi:hypothetical protein
MGSLVKCDACGHRSGIRPTSVYWRWERADKVWKGYYGRLCPACTAAKVLPLDIDYSEGRPLTCPQCGIGTEDDYDAVYLTYYPAGRNQESTDAPFCGVHAAEYRLWVTEFARDTGDDVGASKPQRDGVSAAQTLRALGRSPNVGR